MPALVLALLVLVVTVSPDAVAQNAGLTPEPCLGGPPDAPIRMEVFSDFECPGCREFYLNAIRPVLKDYCSLGKVCVVYREFPLQGHQYSRQAAQYSKAAQRLGPSQWHAVLDALYEQQEAWARTGKLDDVVFKALGADEYFRLKKLLLDPAVDGAIQSEIALGQKKEVTSTPTFFLYSLGREQRVVGGLPYPVLRAYFDTIVR